MWNKRLKNLDKMHNNQVIVIFTWTVICAVLMIIMAYGSVEDDALNSWLPNNVTYSASTNHHGVRHIIDGIQRMINTKKV